MPSPRSWAAARGRRLAGWLLGCALLTCTVSAARAQEQVLLLAPETPDPVLIELYHRLEAELRIHGFDTVTLVSAAPEDSASNMLGAQASARHAFAAIAVLLRNHAAALDVWLVDRETGRSSLRTLSASAGDETANLVAVRAVDLLRSSVAARSRPVQDTSPAAQPAPTSAEARAGPTPKTAQAPAATSGVVNQPGAARPAASTASSAPEPEDEPEPDTKQRDAPAHARSARIALLTFRAEAFGLWQGSRFGVALGPALSVSLSLLDRLRLGVMAAGARGLSRLDTTLGTASVQQELFGLELELSVISVGALQLSAAGGGGVLLLQAEGHVAPPLVSQPASQWTWTASVGPRLSVALSANWSLTAAVRVRLLVPDVVVAVSSQSARLGRPSLDAALGLAFSP